MYLSPFKFLLTINLKALLDRRLTILKRDQFPMTTLFGRNLHFAIHLRISEKSFRKIKRKLIRMFIEQWNCGKKKEKTKARMQLDPESHGRHRAPRRLCEQPTGRRPGPGRARTADRERQQGSGPPAPTRLCGSCGPGGRSRAPRSAARAVPLRPLGLGSLQAWL